MCSRSANDCLICHANEMVQPRSSCPASLVEHCGLQFILCCIMCCGLFFSVDDQHPIVDKVCGVERYHIVLSAVDTCVASGLKLQQKHF